MSTPPLRSLVVASACALSSVAMTAPTMAAPTIQPQPAEIMPLAVHDRLLDITTAGDTLITVGDRGHILRSKDGKDWQQVNVPVRAMLNAVEFVDDNTGWAIGHDQAVLKTTDSGKTWALQHFHASTGRPKTYYGILALDANNAMIVGSYGALKRTTDGGKTWVDIDNPISELGFHLNGITQLNDGTLMIVGERSVMGRSNDGGKTWQMLKTPYSGSWFGVLPYGDKGALLYGLRGNIYHAVDVSKLAIEDPEEWDEFSLQTITDPAKLTALGWQHLPTNSINSLLGATQLPDGEALLVGVNGAIFKTDRSKQAVHSINNPHGTTLGNIIVHGNQYILAGKNGIQTLNK